MTVVGDARPLEDGPAATRARRRRTLGWVGIGLVVVAVGGVAAMIAGISTLPASGLLDPDAAGPSGSKALVQILRDHGVDVVVADSRAEAESALAEAAAGGPATLVITDTAPLSDRALRAVAGAADDVVIVEPRARDLRVLVGGSELAGFGDVAPVDPACALAAANRAGSVAPGSLFTPGDGVASCYPTPDGDGLLMLEDDGRQTSAVDGTVLFTNDTLALDGNAALALNLMGRHPVVVWYSPDLADSDLTSAPTIGELTPPWVTPVMTLLLLTAIVAAMWRGRRFGPLVAETLPVTVRIGETTAGRARLYARAREPVHAADQLRFAALRRLARMLGLGRGASAPEIADATAACLGADRAVIRDILMNSVPTGNRELVDLADRLRDVENAVQRAVRPERNSP